MRYEVQVNNARLQGPSYFAIDTKRGYNVIATFFDRDHADQFVWLMNHQEQALEKFFENVTKQINTKFESKST